MTDPERPLFVRANDNIDTSTVPPLLTQCLVAEYCGTFGLVFIGTGALVVNEMTGGGVHYSFEAIGLKQTTEQAFDMLRPGGTATVIGMVPYGPKIEIHAADFLQEKKLLGCAMGANRFRVDMPRYVDFYLAGRLKLDDLLEEHIQLEQVNDAFDALKTGEVARKVIDIDH